MEKKLKPLSRVALITGAARRIGAALALHLHQAGFKVAIHYHRSQEAALTLSDLLNQKRANSARVFMADLTRKDENQALMSQVMDWTGRLDLLVNNASVFAPTRLDDPDDALWDVLFMTNVRAPFWLSLAARPPLEKSHGSIVNITDIHAESPLKGYAEYCQSKAALMMQTKALAREFAPKIRVNAIAPGAITWPEGENALPNNLQAEIISKTLLRRHGEPAFIAQALLALVENPFITGQTLRVDGGR